MNSNTTNTDTSRIRGLGLYASTESPESAALRRKHAAAIEARQRSLCTNPHTKSAVIIEIRAAANEEPASKLAALERESADLDAKLAAYAARGDLADRRHAQARALETKKLHSTRLAVDATRARSNAEEFRSLETKAAAHLEKTRYSLERLEAGTYDTFARLADIHDAIVALEFFAATHDDRMESHARTVKSADKMAAAASAEEKAAAAELDKIEKEIASAEKHADAEWNSAATKTE